MKKIESNLRTTESFARLSTFHNATSSNPSGRVSDRYAIETSSCEEVLIVDDRSGLRPAQAVENRLSRMLTEATMPISHLQMRGVLRTR